MTSAVVALHTDNEAVTPLKVELDKAHLDALKFLAAEQEMSTSAVMRQALRLYQLVHQRAKLGQELAFTQAGRLVSGQKSLLGYPPEMPER